MTRTQLSWALAALFLTGCAHKPETVEPAPEKKAAAPAKAAPVEEVNKCSRDSDCKDGQLCIREECVDMTLGLAECRNFQVNFAFNSSDFDPASKADLDRMARCLRAAQSARVMIEGNADERGTEEYNLQLGSKRASTIEKYLLALGVTTPQLSTISYGENKPVCREQDEACFARNRRAEVKPSEPAPKGGKKK